MLHMRVKQLWQPEETFRPGHWDCSVNQGTWTGPRQPPLHPLRRLGRQTHRPGSRWNQTYSIMRIQKEGLLLSEET